MAASAGDEEYQAVAESELGLPQVQRTGTCRSCRTTMIALCCSAAVLIYALSDQKTQGWVLHTADLVQGTMQAAEVYINNLNIDIRKQNGLTANLDAGVKFSNDMANSFYRNNNAASTNGDVYRANGVFNNNAASMTGHTIRANGIIDSTLDRALVNKKEGSGGDSEEALADSLPTGLAPSQVESDPMGDALHQELHTAAYLAKTQSSLVNQSLDTFSRLNLNTTHYNQVVNDSSMAEFQAFINSLNASQNSSIHIDNVNFRVWKQNGLQANIQAGVDFNNSMPGSFHDNNNANSTKKHSCQIQRSCFQ